MSASQYEEFIKLRAAIVRAVGITWRADDVAEPDPDADAFKKKFLTDPLQAMRDEFGYEFPFHAELKVLPSDAATNPHHFDPTHTGGWVGTNNTVRLFLPPAPVDAKQKAEALAAFNKDNPVFLPLKERK